MFILNSTTLKTVSCLCLALLLAFQFVSPLSAERLKDLDLPSTVSIEITEVGLKPSTLTLSPGTTVVWENHSNFDIKVKFVRNAVSTTCKAPKGFVLDKRGVFESDKIVNGAVASLCFLEKKDYHFEVEVLDADIGEIGKTADTEPALPKELKIQPRDKSADVSQPYGDQANSPAGELIATLDVGQKLQGIVSIK